MAAIFVFGTLWFWLLTIVALCLIVATTEVEDSNSWGWVILIVALLGMYFGGNRESFNAGFRYIAENPGNVILCVLGYLFLGVFWSLLKWHLYLKHLVQKSNQNKSGFFSSGVSESRFEVSENKQRIINWMTYWPCSALWTLVDHPVRKLFLYIFSIVEKTYQRMSDNAKKGLVKK
jgi:hypothetical protein